MVNFINYTLVLFCTVYMICTVTAQSSNNPFENASWPIAFKKICSVAQETDKYIKDIIAEYDKKGFQCAQGTYNNYNVKDTCDTLNSKNLQWGPEFHKLTDIFHKLYAGINCVAELMTGQSFN